MTDKVAGPDGSALSEGLGLLPERDLVERLFERGIALRCHPVANGTIEHTEEAGELLVQASRKLDELRTLIQRVAKYPANVDCAGTLLHADVMRAAGPPETWKA